MFCLVANLGFIVWLPKMLITLSSNSTSHPIGRLRISLAVRPLVGSRPGSSGSYGSRPRCSTMACAFLKFPMKSITVQCSFPMNLRSPRPNCWKNTRFDSVGRRKRRHSTKGKSMPSLRMSTTHRTFSSPRRKLSRNAVRSSCGVSEMYIAAGMPAAWKL